MSYQVLARKWRPQNFDQVVGQNHVLRALINALDNDRLHHAYLFTGTRGVGKTSLARVFAKSLNCERGVSSKPCGVCSVCLEVDEGRFVDLIEVDAASRTKVDETRDLLDNVQYAATRGRYKVYLIDEVHMFSTHSFNALLKTLEEPPPHVKFLLATTDPKKLPVTILSRCLQFNLKRVPVDQLSTHLTMIVEQENLISDEASIAQLARAADGSVRDALSLLDQAIAYSDGKLNGADIATMLGTIAGTEIFKIVDAIACQDGMSLIGIARTMAESAPDYHHVLGELLSVFRRIAVVQALKDQADTLDESPEIVAFANAISAEEIQLYYQIGLIGRRDLSLAPEPQSGFEMVLIRMLAFQRDEAVVAVGSSTESAPGRKPSPPEAPARKAPRTEEVKRNGVQQASSFEQPDVIDSASHEHAAKNRENIEQPPSLPVEKPPTVSVSTSGELDWHELTSQLRLEGLVRELARNTTVATFSGKLLELAVEPQHENLKAERLVNGLENALATQANMDVKIKLVVTQSDTLDTPAKRLSAEEQAKQDQAEAVIAADPTVQTLQSEFGATIESVSPK